MKGEARGVIVLIFDTLRADFERLCREAAVPLDGFSQLRSLCSLAPPARCGSFPTGPMRTDLLTGRLAFLSGEWALPRPGEETLLDACRQRGFWTTLVSDNYVATLPRLGGMLLDRFDTVELVRGAGSDPWTIPSPRHLAAAREMALRRPTRSAAFEAQFVANAQRWGGVPPFQRVFDLALEHLAQAVEQERFLLWVDTFACHEPWTPLAVLSHQPEITEEPVFPGYVAADLYPPGQLERLRHRFVQRIGETSSAMERFVAAVGEVMARGDTALVVLSDHGFLFGEFGFVGKPAETPLPPELHELVCWLSGHFAAQEPWPSLGIQPHDLHWRLRRALGLAAQPPPASSLHVFARNSPRSSFVTAADEDHLHMIEATAEGCARCRSIRRSLLDPALPLMAQGEPALEAGTRAAMRTVLSSGESPWLIPFRQAL